MLEIRILDNTQMYTYTDGEYFLKIVTNLK